MSCGSNGNGSPKRYGGGLIPAPDDEPKLIERSRPESAASNRSGSPPHGSCFTPPDTPPFTPPRPPQHRNLPPANIPIQKQFPISSQSTPPTSNRSRSSSPVRKPFSPPPIFHGGAAALQGETVPQPLPFLTGNKAPKKYDSPPASSCGQTLTQPLPHQPSPRSKSSPPESRIARSGVTSPSNAKSPQRKVPSAFEGGAINPVWRDISSQFQSDSPRSEGWKTPPHPSFYGTTTPSSSGGSHQKPFSPPSLSSQTGEPSQPAPEYPQSFFRRAEDQPQFRPLQQYQFPSQKEAATKTPPHSSFYSGEALFKPISPQKSPGSQQPKVWKSPTRIGASNCLTHQLLKHVFIFEH